MGGCHLRIMQCRYLKLGDCTVATVTWSWTIPGAVGAAYTLLMAIPATHRRRCAARAELLAKLVAAAGESCPKALRAEMIEKINWVAAYSVIRYTGKQRLIVWGGWVVSITFVAFSFTAVAIHEGGQPPRSLSMFLGTAVGIAIVCALLIIPVVIVMDWMYARRLLYVKVGGRNDFVDLQFPGLRRRGYSSGVVKRLLAQVFGDRAPYGATKPGDILALRRAMSEWENSPITWPSWLAARLN
ncbi:hypothetical protein ACFYO1_02950 [Nocardia sp. NPDC006044]|uniref:hypothetical protein n=1 Tax=Nocardia sp. NPDC006044 TaxID=3364306 RepID=UPI00369962A1